MHKKKPDSIISEVWANRDEYAARFNYDVAAIFRDIRIRQKRSNREYLTYPARHTTPEKDHSIAS
ncbi:MAG: hypothetical protein F4109_12910 [Gammaproteobacteria bacterium]|nr:hypothetical protein [Gammaproteobacteria bacterium]MYD01566.1 hypothetical protein [Gammaproteobacteria bacterium]MYI26313.1 hypothetical protein [Gammaproteobacteria bacterium]